MHHDGTPRSRAPLRRHTHLPWLRLEESHSSDGTLQLTLEGELDIATAEPVRKRLRELQVAGIPATVDLSAISFIDCSGLRVILEALQAAERDSSSLEISPEYPRALRRLLELIEACGLANRLRGMNRLAPPAPARVPAAQRSAGPA